MMLYSKVVTIRDKQLEENKMLENEWIDEQKRLDVMMEIERLKQCQEQEIREVRKKESQKKGAQVIIDQIMERDQQRIAEQELRDKERAQLHKNIEEMKKEDVRQA
jgi:23S rRNA A2030 N6-methylase RlmJ